MATREGTPQIFTREAPTPTPLVPPPPPAPGTRHLEPSVLLVLLVGGLARLHVQLLQLGPHDLPAARIAVRQADVVVLGHVGGWVGWGGVGWGGVGWGGVGWGGVGWGGVGWGGVGWGGVGWGGVGWGGNGSIESILQLQHWLEPAPTS